MQIRLKAHPNLNTSNEDVCFSDIEEMTPTAV